MRTQLAYIACAQGRSQGRIQGRPAEYNTIVHGLGFVWQPADGCQRHWHRKASEVAEAADLTAAHE